MNRLKVSLKELYSQAPPVNPVAVEKTIAEARKGAMGQRQLRPIRFFELLRGQLHFVAKPIWLLQAAVLAALCLLVAFQAENGGLGLSSALFGSAVFIAMTALPFYRRAKRWGMFETEAATRLSLARLMLAKLCIIGLGDAVALCLVTAAAMRGISQPALTALRCVIAPYLLACVGTLVLLNRVQRDWAAGLSAIYCLGLGLLLTLAEDKALLAGLSLGWLLFISFALAALLLAECCRMLRQIPANNWMN